MSSPKYPRGERVWMSFFSANHDLKFIITSKESSREYYFLYELLDGSFKKIGKARSPKDLEEKFEVRKRTEVVR